MRLFVGGIPYSTTEEELRALFTPLGSVTSASVVTDRDTGRSRGFGFVDMPEDEEARKAVQQMNGRDVGGRAITVNEARQRTGGGGGGGYGGGGGGGGGGGRW